MESQNLNEQDRKELNNINRELMVANTDYEELVKNLARTGLRIFRLILNQIPTKLQDFY